MGILRRGKRGEALHKQAFGFLLIAASLAVIAFICGLQVHTQLAARRDQNRAQGVSLARLLSSMPFPQLVADAQGQGPLAVVKTSQSNPDFAYAGVSAADGRMLREVTAPGVIAPVSKLPSSPAEWIGERLLGPGRDGRRVREFLSPVIAGGERVAHVRIGFFEPGYEVFLEQASFLALCHALTRATEEPQPKGTYTHSHRHCRVHADSP